MGHGPLVRGNKIIYVMRISDVLGYEEYYTDPRFAEKKADAGCWQKRCGDNIYYSDREGRWRQATSYFHTKPARESSDDGTPDAFGTFWRRLSREAKVTDLHFHDLRHTFATWLQNLGVPLEVRAALLGTSTRQRQRSLGGK